ncbi:MAG: Threonylcarbamoyl-AMP synthase [Methanoregula sp. PtaU1.Bin051]|nr:MAG: Threonylcarbamoyl-AMP synthase [Methanoregula sp. PtaU1.Bin051]
MDIIEKAVSVLAHDGTVIYPTETVYGLGADAFSDNAIAKVYEAKKRPLSQPISVAVSDYEMLSAVAHVEPGMEEFIQTFLPGPVTVVLRAKHVIPDILTGGTGLIGIRIPAHELALRLIERFDSPITATSANLHGAKDPATPDECTVPRDLLIDAGRLPGTPSTVVDCTTMTILRRGAEAGRIEQYLSGRQ